MQTDKKKILIVEDDVSLLRVLNDQLISEGFVTVCAANGKIGLEKALAEKPDLILLDILMPIMDGLTMLQKLRQTNEYGKTAPVILLTNLSADNEEIIRKVAETEPAYYIVKSSYSIQEVVEKINDRLARVEG